MDKIISYLGMKIYEIELDLLDICVCMSCFTCVTSNFTYTMTPYLRKVKSLISIISPSVEFASFLNDK